MRYLTALTVMLVAVVFGGTASPGQSEQAKQEVVTQEVQIEKFWAAARKQIALDKKYRPKQACTSVRKAIKFYRSKAWGYQDELRIHRSPTAYPERIPGRCGYLNWRVNQWRIEAKRHRKSLTRFLSGSNYDRAKHIVCTIFPSSTCMAALSVVGCETGQKYNASAHNSSTDVRGYFQIDSGNLGRTLRWNGRSIILSGDLFDPWNNTRMALWLSKGGTDWHEWHCQPWVGVG